MEECKRWLVTCSRKFFAEKNITRSFYICALHWPGESSFIDEECVDEKCAVAIHTFALTLQESWLLIKALRCSICSKYELSAKVESMV